jgi:hydroxymethylglutaryl-CoA lyase
MGASGMIRIFEVGPRDGLQNESAVLQKDQRLVLIEKLAASGLTDIEIGAFVRPDRIPQMAGTEELYKSEKLHSLQRQYPETRFWSLVPNEKGLQRSQECGAKNIAVFGGATETFVRKNIGMSIRESLDVFERVVQAAKKNQQEVRGYISVSWVCPYEGVVKPDAVMRVAQAMLDMGIPQISLGDTIGKAHPENTERLITALLKLAPADHFAVHFHDTYGMAIANIDRSIRLGIRTIDSSIGGLGGCPYAAGATGNVATEDVYTLIEDYEGAQILDVGKLLEAAAYAQSVLRKKLPSKRLQATGTHQGAPAAHPQTVNLTKGDSQY